MFGGQDDNAQAPQPTGSGSDSTLTGVDDLAASLNAQTDASASPPVTDSTDNKDDGFMPAPSEPPQSSVPAPHEEAEDIGVPAPTGQPTGESVDHDELLELKQQALQQLTPIVGHLDQTPEEKFRTTMMLIQASDNQTLLKEAYEAAQGIEDEKLKAQALLDVVNEINYFTQNKQ